MSLEIKKKCLPFLKFLTFSENQINDKILMFCLIMELTFLGLILRSISEPPAAWMFFHTCMNEIVWSVVLVCCSLTAPWTLFWLQSSVLYFMASDVCNFFKMKYPVKFLSLSCVFCQLCGYLSVQSSFKREMSILLRLFVYTYSLV